MKKDFWLNARVAVLGGGSWGTVLANLLARNCQGVTLWMRSEEVARSLNATRKNDAYLPDLTLDPKVRAVSDLARIFEEPLQAMIWALPSAATRGIAKEAAPKMRGDEILLHATKGVEAGSLKRMSVVLGEELPSRRIGVISGPNLAHEVARNEPAATVVASVFDEVIEAGTILLENENFRVYESKDVVGVEWCGTLKNILAIASGCLDALGYGWNARAMLMSRGLAEMVRFGQSLGAKEETFLGLAGMGDLLATCSSPLSRNYRVGNRLGKGETLAQVEGDIDTAEGVRTARIVWAYAQERELPMPITEAVVGLLDGVLTARQALSGAMAKPKVV